MARLPTIHTNPLWLHVAVADAYALSWLDDYVMGACMTSGGVSNGKLNVSPKDVLTVCMLPVISTMIVQDTILNHNLMPVSDRTGRRIAQTSRFALGGISHFLNTSPLTLAWLERHVTPLRDFDDADLANHWFELRSDNIRD